MPPAPAEVLLVDQSGDDDVAALVDRHPAVRRLASDRRGISRAMNEGMEAATFDRVLVTHDDCVVAADWVGAAARELGDATDLIVTGRVEPGDGGTGVVPSTKTDPAPHDFTGELTCGALYPNNMALSRTAVLAFGGFDERLRFAEDNDLGYRWLRAGRRVRYRPTWSCGTATGATRTSCSGSTCRTGAPRVSSTPSTCSGATARCWGSSRPTPARPRDISRLGPSAAPTAASDDRSGIPRGLPAGLVAGLRRFGARGGGA